MIKLTVLYKKSEGTTFDVDHYLDVHVPMFMDRMQEHCTKAIVDVPTEPDSPFHVMSQVYTTVNSGAEFDAAYAVHAKELMGDLPNYTNAEMIIQYGEERINSEYVDGKMKAA